MANLTPKHGYYVYALEDPRNREVFYIGKGKGKRCHSHQAKVERNGSSGSSKDNRIKAILADGLSVNTRILHESISEAEALDLEAMEIDAHGIENLTNVMRRGSRANRGAAGIGVGIAMVNTWMEMPDARLKIQSSVMPSITPAFLHDCMCGALSDALSGKNAASVIQGINRAISERHLGKYMPIG